MPAPLPEGARFRRQPGVIETDLDAELILLDPASREMFSLNRTGRLVWNELAGLTVGELADRLTAAFDVDRARALADVQGILADLVSAGLIAPAADAP